MSLELEQQSDHLYKIQAQMLNTIKEFEFLKNKPEYYEKQKGRYHPYTNYMLSDDRYRKKMEHLQVELENKTTEFRDSEKRIRAEMLNLVLKRTSLHIAKTEKEVDESISTKKSYINVKDLSGSTPLHYAAIYNNVYLAKRLCEQSNIFVNAQDSNGQTPLHLAAIYDKDDSGAVMQILCQHPDINVNVCDKRGQTPLHSAVINRRKKAAELLCFMKDIHLTKRDANDKMAVMYCTAEEFNIVKSTIMCKLLKMLQFKNPTEFMNQFTRSKFDNKFIFIDYLLRVNTGGNEWKKLRKVMNSVEKKQIMLLDACINNNITMVKILSHHKDVNIDKKDTNGMTPLHHAAIHGHLAVVHLLIKSEGKTLNINSTDLHDTTALHFATYNGHLDVVKLLSTHPEIEIFTQDRNCYTALHYAAVNRFDDIYDVLESLALKYLGLTKEQLDQSFEDYSLKHNKTYSSMEEKKLRKSNFVETHIAFRNRIMSDIGPQADFSAGEFHFTYVIKKGGPPVNTVK